MKGKIHIKLFNQGIVVIVDNSVNSAILKYKPNTDTLVKVSEGYFDSAVGCSTWFYENEFFIPCIVLTEESDFNTIIHESSHTTFKIMDGLGMPNTEDNEEIFCYLNGYISQETIIMLLKKDYVKIKDNKGKEYKLVERGDA